MSKKKRVKVLFLDILTGNPKIKKEEKKVTKGPYGEVFRKKLGLQKSQFFVVDASKGKFPVPREYHGIIIGGSLESPIKGKEKPWMKKTYEFIKEIIGQKVPLLGVCGGHQFIARALGEKVIYNPKGREFGTLLITLTKKGIKDPLFKKIPKKFIAQVSHQCIIDKINPRWKLLASSNLCKTQAVAINARTRIVQFHPELSVSHMRAIAGPRKENFIKQGFTTEKEFKKFLFSIVKTPQATKVLKNFLRYFVIPNLEK